MAGRLLMRTALPRYGPRVYATLIQSCSSPAQSCVISHFAWLNCCRRWRPSSIDQDLRSHATSHSPDRMCSEYDAQSVGEAMPCLWSMVSNWLTTRFRWLQLLRLLRLPHARCCHHVSRLKPAIT